MASGAVVDSLKTHIKQLQAAIQERRFKEAANILALLKAVEATEELLRATKAGLAVSKLKGCEDTGVSQLSKEVISKWKAEVDEQKKKRGGASSADGATTAVKKEQKPNVKLEIAKTEPSSSANTPPANTSTASGSIKPGRKLSYDLKSPGGALRSRKLDGIEIPSVGDKARDKCVELAYDALVFDSGAPSDLVLSRAVEIEKFCFNEAGGTSNDYRTKIRRLYLNIKDKNNPGLRQSVISGDLPVSRLCVMSPSDMASEERKQANELLEAQNLHNSLAAGEPEAETDAFQCGRCKQRKTRYRQAQTRSADEPMTTFVTCVNCGNRWKFC